MDSIKAADCTVGTKRTIWGKYVGVVIAPDGTVLRTLKKKHRNPEDARKEAREVIIFATLLAVQKMNNDTKDN